METKDINRLKIILAEKKKNKWVAEQIGNDPASISKWSTYTSQTLQYYDIASSKV